LPWTIENEYLQLTASSRGHIESLIDKRAGEECLSDGISFWAAERLDGVSLVAEQRDELATLILSATDWERRLTWHAWVSLAPGVASVAVRLAVFNRSLKPVECSPTIEVLCARPVAVVPVRHAAVWDGERLVGSAFGDLHWPLGPHQTAPVQARILPVSHRVNFASEHVVAMIEENEITLTSAEIRPNHMLFVGSAGRTFESRVDLHPGQPAKFALDSLPGPLEAFQLRDGRGNTVLESQRDLASERVHLPEVSSLEEFFYASQESALTSAERIPSVASPAAFARGMLAMRRGRWEDAANFFEDAAILRGDDPLTWWAKNWCLRHLDSGNEHDLPNAHYLAPLDPVLRADAYLSAPEDAKPSALLDAWGSDPQPYLEVADLLHDAGLIDVRARWLEEARHRAPSKLLEWLLAAAHLEQGREMAAGEHVGFSEAVADNAVARRRSELDAVALVRSRFPLG